MKRVSKALMVREDGKVLVLKRSRSLVSFKSPWTWDYPGGHVEDGEDWVVGLEREVFEETGLSVKGAVEYFSTETTKFYKVVSWEGEEISISWEHEQYKWIYPAEISEYYISDDYESAMRHLET